MSDYACSECNTEAESMQQRCRVCGGFRIVLARILTDHGVKVLPYGKARVTYEGDGQYEIVVESAGGYDTYSLNTDDIEALRAWIADAEASARLANAGDMGES